MALDRLMNHGPPSHTDAAANKALWDETNVESVSDHSITSVGQLQDHIDLPGEVITEILQHLLRKEVSISDQQLYSLFVLSL